jgi:hypothetical protein
MLRPVLILSVLAAIAAPAAAANYTARLATPVGQRFIARDIVWACGPGACQGVTGDSRPAVLCQSLAKHAGKIDSFLVDGRAFTDAQLAQCNTAAKADAGKALAAH